MKFVNVFRITLFVTGVILLILYGSWQIAVGTGLMMWANNIGLLNGKQPHEN